LAPRAVRANVGGMEKRYPVGASALVLSQGDITREQVDAIANAANSGLLGGGGVDGAIHRAAGPELLAACRRIKQTLPGGSLPAGGAVATPAFRLPARHVIHCVGPVYDDDPARAPRLLGSCYRRALAIARELGLASIAFPAISTGVYGYPMHLAADVAVRAVKEDLGAHGAPALVKMVLFDDRAFAVFAEAADRVM
jgi:O-acetyl-ADP-ribose deacetylase (regulator of RNase III)